MALRTLKTTAAAAGFALSVALTGPVLFFGHVALASAGEYHVYSCRTPSGQPAPTDGWSPSSHPAYDLTANTCESGGGLVAALDAGYAHVADSETDKATWMFKAPDGETIANATLWRAGNTLGGSNEDASYLFWLSGDASLGLNAHIFDECRADDDCIGEGDFASPLTTDNQMIASASALNSSYLSLNTYCGSFVKEALCPSNEDSKITYAAIVELFAADLTLSQASAPTVSAVAGGLAEDPTVSGTSDIAFHAADSGSGVYEALIQLDGQTVDHTVLDEDGGRCRDVGGSTDGLPAFLYTQPCPAALSADLPFDTTKIADGPHHLIVSVTDAAGNATTVLDREIAVANPLPSPAACSTAATGDGGEGPALTARWRGSQGVRLRGRYDEAHTIEGRLTAPAGGGDGGPIEGAQLEVCELPAYTGAPARAVAAPRTGAGGRWSLMLPRDLPSCSLRIAYRSHSADLLVAAPTLTLGVPAALPLRISPRTARSAGTIRFTGRLLGAPIPPGGKQLVLEARSPGGPWIEFHVIRTGPHGRYAYRYHFRLPGPARYQFRVLSEREADFPFAAGESNVVGVLER